MKKIYFTTIILLLTLNSCTQKSYDTEINEIADGANENLPTMVNSETRFDSVSAESGKVYKYHYTLINVEKRNFDVANLAEKRKQMLLNEINDLKNKSGFKFFIENNVTFAFSYDDKNGENLLNILISPSDYR